MTDLVNDYGYASEGESFSIADADEVWIMELIGKGKSDKGAVWVARRVPDDCISGHANHSRIHQFPLDDPETLYAPDVISFARSQGYFDGKDEDFSFSRAYAVTDGGPARMRRPRMVVLQPLQFPGGSSISRLGAPRTGRPSTSVDPPAVKSRRAPDAGHDARPLRGHADGHDRRRRVKLRIKCLYRWRPLTYEVDSTEYTHERAIATQQTGFSFVSQMDSKAPAAMRAILWFGVDDANTCVYVPSTTASLKCLMNLL